MHLYRSITTTVVTSARSFSFAVVSPAILLVLAWSPAIHAQPAPVASSPAVAPTPAEPEKPAVKVTPLGYVEAYYAYNFNRPSNGITNYRGFDNRHNTFTLQNAALGASFEAGPVGGRLVLQVGAVPSTYYLSEPALPGTGSVNASGPELWKYLQEAYLTYDAPVGRGLLFQLGLCASPVGLETFAVKDNWNWSRSNLFFGFPFYHTGLRVTYPWTDELSTTVSIFNGWNTVVDNNEEKSIESNVTYKRDKLLFQALYFGGVERSTGAPEGPYWRHHFDAYAQVDATSWISFAGEADYGWEPNRFGTAKWAAGALYARVQPIKHVFVAVRGDHFHEDVATGAGVSSAPLFWGGVEWVSSGTAALEVQPHDQISIRLEYRHDLAAAPLFFRSTVRGDGSAAAPYVANARTQDTLLLGATAWF
ncbi:MAG: outer membrane beta-barrel protein [Polyangiaceae bacterium]